MPTIYIETTVVSYLTALPSRDPILLAHQQVTHNWWHERRSSYRCVTSDEVLREAGLGHPVASARRTEALRGIEVLAVSEPIRELARSIVVADILPPHLFSDAIHATIASVHEVDILLTWNCRHLANPSIMRRLRAFLADLRFTLPEICTPVTLAEGEL